MTARLPLVCSALALCFGLSMIPAAHAMDSTDSKTAEETHKGTMKDKKHKDGMMKGDAMKGSMMKGGAMKKDDTAPAQ